MLADHERKTRWRHGCRYLVIVLFVVGGVGAWWTATGAYWSDREAQFDWLLRRDAGVLRSEQDPSWWDGLTLPWRRYRLNAAYQQFLSRHPDHHRARVAYGNYLYDQHHEEAAVAQWEQALQHDPRLALAWNNLGEYHVHDGRVAEGLQHFQQAIALEPQRAIYRFNWAMVCSSYRRDAAALYAWSTAEIMTRCLAEFRLARQLDPNDLAIARAYAEMFDCLTDPDWREAYEAWRYCAQQARDPLEQQMIYGRLARVAMRLREFGEARDWVTRMTHPGVDSLRRALERKQAALEAGAPDTRVAIMRAVDDADR